MSETRTRSVAHGPAVAFFAAAVALPVLSLVLAGPVEARLLTSDPGVAHRAIPMWVFLALVTVAIGSLWTIGVPALVWSGRRRPRQLLFVLGPVARVGLAGLAAVVLLEGVLATAIVLGLEILAFGQAYPGSAAPILIGCFAGVYYLSVGTSGQITVEPKDIVGVEVDLHWEPRLATLIDDLSQKLNVRRPDRVLVGTNLDCFVTEVTLRVQNELIEGRSLCLSWPLTELLTPRQMRAVVAHELGHFAGGHTGEGPLLERGVMRLQTAIERLADEHESFARLSIQPALLWLQHLQSAVADLAANVVRSGELDADRIAAGVVGSQDLASALVAIQRLSSREDEWTRLVRIARRSEGSLVEAVREFGALVEAERDATRDEVEESGDIEASLPSDEPLAERLAALEVLKGVSAVAPDAPESRLFDDSEAMAAEILAAVAPADQRRRSVIVNPARLDIGLAAWLTVAILFTTLFVGFAVAGIRAFARGDTIPIILIIEGPIALFPLVYLALQREVRFRQEGIEIRSWLAALLRRPGRQLTWTPDLGLDVGQSMLLTVSDRRGKSRIWADIWVKREFWRLVDACRRRDLPVRFGPRAYGLDDERRAVVWLAGDLLLVPRVVRTDDGRLIEAQPVARVSVDPMQLAAELSAAFARAPKGVARSTAPATTSSLARLAGLEVTDYVRQARRMTIGGHRHGWTIAVDGVDEEWSTSGPIDARLAAFIAFSMLGINPERDVEDRDQDGGVEIEVAPME